MATQKIVIQKLEVGKVAQLGNSMNWSYQIAPEGHAIFVGRDAHSHGYIMEPETGNPDRPRVKPGDRIWFSAEGRHSRWGILTPPKNPARRVFWEAGVYIPREKFVFNCSDIADRYNSLLPVRQLWMADWHHRQVVCIGDHFDPQCVAELYLEDRGNCSPWKVLGIWYRKCADVETASKEVLKYMRR